MCQCVMYASPARSIGVAGKFHRKQFTSGESQNLYINKAGCFPRQLGFRHVVCNMSSDCIACTMYIYINKFTKDNPRVYLSSILTLSDLQPKVHNNN